MDRFKIGIIGAADPAGAELVRLILEHPMCELVAVSASGHQGELLCDLLPRFRSRCDMRFIDEERLIEEADVVFNADQSLDAQEIAAVCIKNKSVFIDMCCDFRLNDSSKYALWNRSEYRYPMLHDAAVYSIPELTRNQLAGKVIVSVPGAIAAATLSMLIPPALDGLIEPSGIVVSAAVPWCALGGTYPAPVPDTMGGSLGGYAGYEYYETSEIENMLETATGRTASVTVLPTVTPVPRGMVIACRAGLTNKGSAAAVRSSLERIYSQERFIRILSQGGRVNTAEVINTNFCDISIESAVRTGSVILSAALDYFMKGSAGLAVQNMNALLNMPEYFGLDFAPKA